MPGIRAVSGVAISRLTCASNMHGSFVRPSSDNPKTWLFLDETGAVACTRLYGAKAKSGNCSLEKWAVTAVCLCIERNRVADKTTNTSRHLRHAVKKVTTCSRHITTYNRRRAVVVLVADHRLGYSPQRLFSYRDSQRVLYLSSRKLATTQQCELWETHTKIFKTLLYSRPRP